MTKASATRIDKKLREKQGRQEWPVPKSGLLLFQQTIQRHQQESRQILQMLAEDAGVPDGTKAEFDGTRFVEREESEE